MVRCYWKSFIFTKNQIAIKQKINMCSIKKSKLVKTYEIRLSFHIFLPILTSCNAKYKVVYALLVGKIA